MLTVNSMWRLVVAVSIVAFSVATTSGSALAHTYGVAGAGFAAGFVHPLGGIDHLFVMLAAGAGAAQLAGRQRHAALGGFMAMMAFGGIAGFGGYAVPGAEWLIALSVVAAGLVIGLQRRSIYLAGAIVFAVSAIVHGNVHGLEAPAAAQPVLYSFGFLGATLLLLTSGFSAGRLVPKAGRYTWRVAGTGMAATGIALITAAV